MKTILTLLVLLACLQTQGATVNLIGGVRRNYDTTGTNTITSAVTISGGTAGTNLYAGMLVATNSVQVGQVGESGVITISSSDGTNTVDVTMDSGGQFRVEPTTPDSEAAFVFNMTTPHTVGPSLQLQNNGNIIFSVDSNSGWTNSGTLFLSDRGKFEVAGGGGVNPTTNFIPLNVNGVFGDSGLHETATNGLYQGNDATEGYTLQFTDANRAAYSMFGADGSHITMDSGSGNVSLDMSPVGGTSFGVNFQPTVGDGTTPYVLSTKVTHTMGDLMELDNNTTNVFTVEFGGDTTSTSQSGISRMNLVANGTTVRVAAESSGGSAETFYIGSSRVATLFGTSLVLPSTGAMGFATGDPYTTGYSTRWQHEGLGIMALDNATQAQILRIYSTTNSGTGDYERLSISPTAATAGIVYNSEAGGAGVTRAHSFNVGGTATARFDANATAHETRFMLYDVDAATMVRVSVGAADSGGTGFKLLRIPN